MSDFPVHPDRGPHGPFNSNAMLTIIGVGVVAFIAMLILGAYAPDLRSGKNGGAHALSNGAIGYSGLVRLVQETGRNPVIVRSEQDLGSEDLAVVTPESGSTDLSGILAARGPRATLLVLPKWAAVADPTHPGWVRIRQLVYPQDPETVLAPGIKLAIARSRGRGQRLRAVGLGSPMHAAFLAPAVVQTMSGEAIEPMIVTSDNRIVLGRVRKSALYVLSDPDLINNHGMGDMRQARAALDLLDMLNSTGASSILFDVTANGLGRSRSPLKLAFDPPFLSVTLTIFVAMLLAGWQALVRFGPIHRAERAIAFGKAALVDNSAALVRRAGREAQLGGRYVQLIRDRAVALFQLPPTLDEVTLDTRLEALNARRSFAAAAAAARSADDRSQLVAAAKSLNRWLTEVQE
ncbi:hypothetical protein [Sphingomonas sp. URHD0057]|uniref:hypothetical protein n=1 Tax=Sphingomonas sp. URHD0057 TaxID=1380389 RepID=UPI00048DEE3D|nr:hypothetical protein [Sphingomonas sp. URHD0057]